MEEVKTDSVETIEIIVPDNFQREREYVIKTLFSGILTAAYTFRFSKDEREAVMRVGGKEIRFFDSWSSLAAENVNPFSAGNLPHPEYVTNEYVPRNDIPAIYGNGDIKLTDGGIYCGIDITASVFFMLTRWEENVNPVRDGHARFPGKESVAYKYHFLRRPVVNEYAEMILNMLRAIGYRGDVEYQGFALCLTHDVDYLSDRVTLFGALKRSAYQLLKRRDVKKAVNEFSRALRDSYNLYDFFMDVSESAGVKSHFYFMAESADTGKPDGTGYLALPWFGRVIDNVKSRGHIAGFHASYFTFGNPGRFREETARLSQTAGMSMKEGRQHFLRVSVPETLRMWNDGGYETDSSLGYADVDGFRCGTGCEFQFYDYKERRELSVRERPLVVMDCSLRGYQNLSDEEFGEALRNYISLGKRYGMPVTFLFHNSFFVGENRRLLKIYREVFGA